MSGLKIVRFRPGKEKQEKGYAAVPLELSLNGAFRDFVAFLNALATIPRLSQVGSLTILAQEPIDHRVPLDIFLEILTYRLPPPFDAPSTSFSTGGFTQTEGTVVASHMSKPATGLASLKNLRDPFYSTQVTACQKTVKRLKSFDLNELRLAGVV